MVKRIGTDWGLNVRMVLTLFLLACVYLAFMGALYYFGVNAGFIIVIALVLALAQYYWSDKLILLSLGAQEVSEQQAPQLHDMVGRLAAMTGLPKPKVAIIDSPVPNAMATGRNPNHSLVAVTTGILGMLSPEEMEAVLAHEMSHVIHRDMRVMAMASFFATVASFIVQSGMWGGFGGRRGGRDSGNSFFLIFLVSIVVWAISFVLIRTLSRYREYSADRGSAIITGQPSQLASALVKISGRMQRIPDQDLRQVEAGNTLMIFPAISRGSISEIFSTHPSLEHRLAKLQEMEASLAH
jgi:heat shock protein HtpX